MNDKNQTIRNVLSTQIKQNNDITDICETDIEPDRKVEQIRLKCYNSNHAMRRILDNLK